MSAMISIDFGNSYTKVAVRPTANKAAKLMTDKSLTLDEWNVCIPTLAACMEQRGTERWFFGNEVMQQSSGTSRLRVFRNWKPRFFKGVETHLARRVRAPMESAHSSGVFSMLTEEQWSGIKTHLNLPESARAAIEMVMRKDEGTAPSGSGEETDIDAKQIGLGFFRWLADFVGPFCEKQGLGRISELPVRISLPSFGAATKAEMLLREILEESGWMPAERAPALPEPLANSIGAFSEGRNSVHRPTGRADMPHYGRMFENTGLLRAMRDATLHGGPKTAWAMIADLGGYTADFAMVCLDLEDIDAPVEGTMDGKPRTATYSEPIGVTTLDRRVRRLLDHTKAAAMDELQQDPDQRRLETFHRTVYGGKTRVYRLRQAVIGEGGEHERIQSCVHEFGVEVADYAEKFLEIHQYDRIDDLILTGGGSMIPAVRDELNKRLKRYSVRKTHMYLEPGTKAPSNFHALEPLLVRGATALGGASVYFDFAQ